MAYFKATPKHLQLIQGVKFGREGMTMVVDPRSKDGATGQAISSVMYDLAERSSHKDEAENTMACAARHANGEAMIIDERRAER